MNNLIFNIPIVTGKTNSTIVKISKLNNKKYRNEEKMFIFDGVKLFKEAVDFGAKIRYIVLNNNAKFDEKIVEKIKFCNENGAKILCVEDYVFDKLTTENAPQGIVTVCEYIEEKYRFFTDVENASYDDEFVVALESVRDPGNLGAIMRNAVAFGVDRLVLSSDCVDIYSPKVVRASMGAFFKIKIDVVADLPSLIANIKKAGKNVFGAALEKESLILGKDKITSKDIIVLGNEGHGLSEKTLGECTNTVFIPMKENTESLNVAIASAILMWEISK